MAESTVVHDFILYTDGSGRELDGYSGYAALAKTPDNLVKRFVMGAMTESTVDRAEFTALIEGLRICWEMWERFPNKGLRREGVVRPKPKIKWYSDRENLVLAVKRVYDRSNQPDLWAAFEYFENLMEIDAQSVTEPFTDTDPSFVEVDLQSSSLRQVIQAYTKNTPLTIDVQPKPSRRKAAKTDSQDK